MFNDEDERVKGKLKEASERYQEWEGEMSDRVVGGERLVVIEVGCGRSVPCVRMEGYEVAGDIMKRNGKAEVAHIRINLGGDARHIEGVDLSVGSVGRRIEIDERAVVALRAVDKMV